MGLVSSVVTSGYKLSNRALLLGSLAFAFLLAAQLALRYWVHLPALAEVQNLSDQKDRARVEAALAHSLQTLQSRVLDNALWNDAYQYVQHPSQAFIDTNFDERTLLDSEVSGVMFLDARGELIWFYGFAWGVRELEGQQISAPPFDTQQTSQYVYRRPQLPAHNVVALARGYLKTPQGPLQFVSAPVYPTNLGGGDAVSAGSLVMWRWLDSSFWQSVSEQTQLQVKVDFTGQLPLAASAVRNADNQLHWPLQDVQGQLLGQLQLQLPAPPYEQQLFTGIALVGLLAALLLLLVMAWAVKHLLVTPLKGLGDQMADIMTGGKFNRRLHIHSYRELQSLAGQFNDLLAEVERQQGLAQQRQAELLKDATTDGLTGLSNRRYLDQFMDQCWSQARAEATAFGLFLVDVDNFKDYNDSYGHAAGDQVLKAVADVLAALTPRQQALAARYGGEEFCLVFNGFSDAVLADLAHRICATVQRLAMAHRGATAGYVTVSVGWVYVDGALAQSGTFAGRHALRALFKAADGALYEAKRAGRNQVVRAAQVCAA